MGGWNRGLRVLAVASLGLLALSATHLVFEWSLLTEATLRRFLFGGFE